MKHLTESGDIGITKESGTSILLGKREPWADEEGKKNLVEDKTRDA